MSSDFKGAIAEKLHHTQSAPKVDPYYYYTHKYIQILIPSRYPGTMTLYFKVLGSQYHFSMY